MIYSENLTIREQLINAMPLVSLTRKEWGVLHKHIEEVEEDSELFKVMEKLNTNQSRIEVIGNYLSYYSDLLDKTVAEEETGIIF